MTRRRARRLLLTSALAWPASGCDFDSAGQYAPSYDCADGHGCGAGASCTAEGVCAVDVEADYPLLVRLQPTEGAADAPSAVTLPPTRLLDLDETLTLPAAATTYGVVRFAGAVVPGQLVAARAQPIAGLFADEQLRAVPSAAASLDGQPADYRLAHVDAAVRVTFTPSPATVTVVGLPTELSTRRFDEVFPPIAVELPQASGERTRRLDLVYPDTLFEACGSGAVACTATGRLRVRDDVLGTAPQAGVRVWLESTETERRISTEAVTGPDGRFVIRAFGVDRPHRLRLAASPERPGLPTIGLAEGAFDVTRDQDVEVPAVDTVRYVARAEFGGVPVADALVRISAREVVDVDARIVRDARVVTTARTTLASAPEGPGYLSVELAEGAYDLAVSADGGSAVARAVVTVRRPTFGTVQLGQVVMLPPAVHLGGVVRGPDGRVIPYASVEALPYVPNSAVLGAEAYARYAEAVTDLGGLYDLAGDLGYYDLHVSLPFTSGLAPSVITALPIGGVAADPIVDVTMRYPVVRRGVVKDSRGVPLPGARLSFFLTTPSDGNAPERAMRIADATSDEAGAYWVALPPSVTRR